MFRYEAELKLFKLENININILSEKVCIKERGRGLVGGSIECLHGYYIGL